MSETNPAPKEEDFDVCDAENRVVGRASRAEVHARGLLHRATHMFVFRTDGRMLIHKRSHLKEDYPGVWTSSASGHVSAGEDYDASAARELQEELGLSAPLERVGYFRARPELANEHTVLYRATTDDEPTFDPAEIDDGAYHAPDEIDDMIAADPDRFAPSFRLLFAWFRAHE